ncbi:MAG: hypothetical protein ACREDA_04905, partial [Methylocella sp.]
MRAPWRGTGFLGAPALALLPCLAGFPACAGDAPPRLGAAAPASDLLLEARPGLIAMAPAHGVLFAEPAPAAAEPRDGAAQAPS